MDYQDIIKRQSKIVVISIIAIGVAALIAHFIGTRDTENRKSQIVASIQGETFSNSYEFSDEYSGAYHNSRNITFDPSKSKAYIISEHTSSYSSDTSYGAGQYDIVFDFFGRERIVIDIDWNDNEDSTWDFRLGKDKNEKVVLLDAGDIDSNFTIQEHFADDSDSNVADIGKTVTYKNKSLSIVFIVIASLCGILCVVSLLRIFISIHAHKKVQKNKEREKKQEQIDSRKQALSVQWSKQTKQLNYNEQYALELSTNTLLWVTNDTLYEAESKELFLDRFLNSDNDPSTCLINSGEVAITDIQYYTKEGDVQYTTKVSGGGGGGISVAGTLVGGLIAGGAGAIIGSRKKIEEVKSESVKHDSRRTLIRYYKDNQILVLSYAGFEVYNYLLKTIPDKDLLTIQLRANNFSEKPNNDDSLGIDNRLSTLKRLYENNLISKEEYEEKRVEIIGEL